MEQALIQTAIKDSLSSPGSFSSLADELAHYRRQTKRLTLINQLHARLLAADDLQGMVEAFSVWLMPLVEHELIAYSNKTKNKHHVFCSCHGPERRAALSMVEEKLTSPVEIDSKSKKKRAIENVADYQVHTWKFDCAGDNTSISVVFQNGRIDDFHSDLLREAVAILDEPLQRVIDFEDLYVQARQDSLTGLANRRVLDERIGPMIETARRHNRPLTLLSMDLDRFKLINDNFGHAAGDRVLQQVSLLMSGMVRKSDLLVRMGGDEFILLLPDTRITEAETLAGRLCETVEALDLKTPDGDRLGISIGISQWQQNLDVQTWLQRADEVLYKAKHSGRGRVVSETIK